jgi:hypothetical protein
MSSLERGSLEAAFFSILSDIEVYKYLKQLETLQSWH